MLVAVLAVEVDVVRLPTTALQMLVVILVLAALAAGGLALLTTAATPLVDKRWPADEPLNPTEMLWGETGGYIRRHFPGLDPDAGKAAASGFVKIEIPAGENVVEEGEPSTHFYVIEEGEVEVLQRTAAGTDNVIRTLGPGDTFGEVGILRRSARTATIRAAVESTLLELPAEDFLAAVAFSASEGNNLMGRVNDYLAADARRTAATSAMAPIAPAAASAAAGPAVLDTSVALAGTGAVAFVATHVVPATGLLAWLEPDPSAAPTTTLGPGTELRVVGQTGVWSRVTTSNGWEGWVDGRTLVPR